MRRHRRKSSGGFVEPDLPITPMLDMSFQLLAFFLMTFNPTPTEGHLDVMLPKQEGSKSAADTPNPFDEKVEEITVRIESDDKGDIASIVLLGQQGSEVTLPGSGRTAREALFAELKKRVQTAKTEFANRKAGDSPFVAPKAKLELANNLSFKIVVAVMDECGRAGCSGAAPALKSDKK